MELRIQHVVFNLTQRKHLAQHFRDFDRSGTHQDRTSGFYHLFDFFDDCFILFAFSLVNAVIHILTGNRTVGRDNHYIQLIDVPKFACFGFGSTGHTRKLVVHTEVVLQGNGSECLGGRFNLHTFLGFHRLVQTVAPTTTVHDTTCLFIDNLHLSVQYHIVSILFEHGVSLQELVDGVNTFRLDGIVGEEFVLLCQLFFFAQAHVFQFRQLSCDVRQHEESRISRITSDELNTLVSQIYTLHLFIDDEIQRLYRFRHTLVVLFHVDFFRLEHTCLDTRFTQVFNQRIVLRQCLVATEQGKETCFHILLVFRSNQSLGFCQILGSQLALNFHETFYQRTKLFEQLVFTLRHRTRDNQRSTGIVNQYGVNFIDDGVIMLALYQILRAACHVVAQVVETKFIVGTESNICQISTTTGIRVRLMLVDTIHAQAMELIKWSHPFGVTLGEVIIHGHDVNTISSQGIQEHRQGSYQSLTFTCCHFGNLTLMKHGTPEELHIVVNHRPLHVVTTGNPMVLPNGLIVFDTNEILALSSQQTVKLRSGHYYLFIFRKTACRILHDGKSLGMHFIQSLFVFIQYFLFQLINLSENRLTLFDFSSFDGGLQLFNLLLFFNSRCLDVFL